ncbi:VRR-NUC domain-containing protein [Telluribacter sp.]|uniref:VRR-NUC domain-containing protein n=1 Tax=Telluribacter sp. TaxID=1978767 RepID=UPI002E0FAB63|nr:VRR-NUC domain-containing protein [Telluribacter sp.]
MSSSDPSRTELPPKYYLDYFGYVLDFVQKMYGHILNKNEEEFLRSYHALSEDARCLFIRFSNRRGAFFRINTLAYAEICDIPDALTELIQNGFAEVISEQHAHRAPEVLNLFSKPELLLLTQSLAPVIMPPKTIHKPDLMRWLLHEYSFPVLFEAIEALDPIVKVGYELEVMMMKFLFFGNRHADMTEFVVRDLGHVRYQSFDEEQLSVRFATRQDADDKLMISLTKETFHELKEELPPEEIYDWFMNWQGGLPEELSAVALPSFRQLVLRVGAWLERRKLPEQALTVYQLTDHAPSRERRARLLHRLGDTEEALALCDDMEAHPQNADERFFALDFREKILNKKKRATRRTTQALQAAESVGIPINFRYRVERGVIEYYQERGYNALFSENEPWRALFGLLFWDIIYDTNVQAIHHPLQRVPSDFFLPDFYFKRHSMLKARILELGRKEDIVAAVETTYAEKFGISNVLVGWYPELLAAVRAVVELVRPTQLHAVLLEMAANLRENTRGFPDLLVWNEEEYAFVEVKSPTDHLSARQLHWQHFFADLGVSSKVLRVVWVKDNPEQEMQEEDNKNPIE